MRSLLPRLPWVGIVLLGALAAAQASEPPSDRPDLRITSPRGGQTRQRVVAIEGVVRGVEGSRLTLVLNGVALSIPHEGGRFGTSQVLAPGPNQIRVSARTADGRVLSDDVAVHASVPAKDLRITLTWDTDRTDVDLWVTGPDGEKVFYSHKQGAAGGTLDVDVTTGFGPETFTQARAVPGTYTVQAHYYGSGPPTRIEVVVIRGEGTVEEERHVYRGVLMGKDDVVTVGTYRIER